VGFASNLGMHSKDSSTDPLS